MILCIFARVDAHELSSSFSLFFFAPKSDLTHSMKKMPVSATFLCCGLQVWSRQGVQVWSRKCKSGHAGMTRRLSSALLYVPRAWYNLSRHDYSVTQKDASPFTKKARWWHVGNLLYQPPHRYPLPIELRLYSYFHAESISEVARLDSPSGARKCTCHEWRVERRSTSTTTKHFK